MKTALKKIWQWLNGNKTIICSILWTAIESGAIPLTPEWKEIFRIILGAATTGALAHHVKKGYFTTKK